MPSPAHEIAIAALRDHPEWLDALLVALGHRRLAPNMVPADTALRMVDPVEVHPDLVLVANESSAWALVEVQLGREDDKGRRVLVAASLMLDQRRVMGDVVIITHERHVARWSARAVEFEGAGGTRLSLAPIVVLLTGDEAEALLATGRPELALFAAWAVHDRHGPKARRVVERAIATVERSESEPLRATLVRSILNVLDASMIEWLREKWVMNANAIPESPAFRALRMELEAIAEARGRADGEARGRAEGAKRALLTVLAARGLALSPEQRAQIETCIDMPTLDQWLERAVSAVSVDDLFGRG